MAAIFIDTLLGGFEPREIVFANGGCAAIGQCRRTRINNKKLLIQARKQAIRDRRGR